MQQKKLASSGPLQAAIVIDGEIVALTDWQWLLTAGVKMLKLTPCSEGGVQAAIVMSAPGWR